MVRDIPVISRLLTDRSVLVSMDAGDKSAALAAVLKVACQSDFVVDCDEARNAVIEREKQMSTGVGSGLAIPHARTDAVTGTVAVLGILKSPIDYDSLDGEPVRLVFLLLGPRNDTSRHIRILSRVSRLMNDEGARRQLLQAARPEDVIDIVSRLEAMLLA